MPFDFRASTADVAVIIRTDVPLDVASSFTRAVVDGIMDMHRATPLQEVFWARVSPGEYLFRLTTADDRMWRHFTQFNVNKPDPLIRPTAGSQNTWWTTSELGLQRVIVAQLVASSIFLGIIEVKVMFP